MGCRSLCPPGRPSAPRSRSPTAEGVHRMARAARIVALDCLDLRFPTSATLDGSDAMNPDPDYSAAYVVLRTDGGGEGHGFCFTIGRGNDVCVAAIRAYAPLIVGHEIDLDDLGEVSRRLTHDSQTRW